MNEYDQCIQKYANQDGRCSPMRESKKAMHQFMKFMLEQHCQSDRQGNYTFANQYNDAHFQPTNKREIDLIKRFSSIYTKVD